MSGTGRERGIWFRTILCMVVAAIAAGCWYAWPANENARLIASGAQMAHRQSVRVINARNLYRALGFYKHVGALRIHFQHSGNILAAVDCDSQPVHQFNALADTLVTQSGHGKLLAELACPRKPAALSVLKPALPRAAKPAVPLTVHAAGVQLVSAKASDAAASPNTTEQAAELPPPPHLASIDDIADCSRGTSLNIVAHEDDDLLFLNPDIQADITAGKCVRTVYLTAGDDGQAESYWSGREDGSKAAYAAMYGVADNWHDAYKLLNGRLVAVSHLEGVPQVALVFMRLPDGNLHGDGFAASGDESLQKLLDGHATELHTVDTHVGYTKDQLVADLADVMRTDGTDAIRAPDPRGVEAGDHADHSAAGKLAAMASAVYAQPHTLTAYVGYPERLSETNLTDHEVAAKEAVFMAYAKHDNAVCQTVAECMLTTTYGNFLTRQYRMHDMLSGQPVSTSVMP